MLRLRLSVELSQAMASLGEAERTLDQIRREGGVVAARQVDSAARAISNASQALSVAWEELRE